jgi:hypothetical protein
MRETNLDRLDWHKSSYSDSVACIEVALSTVDAILVRDSKAGNAGHLMFKLTEWRSFIAIVGAGGLDPGT